MAKPHRNMAKKKPVTRIHTVHLSNGRGYSDTEVLVRTDGTVYEKRVIENFDSYASLKDLVPKLTKILAEHPEATLDEEQRKYEDGTHTVIEWWEPLREDDPAVVQLLADAKRAEELQRERDERELERLKRERPDLFKKR